jgi:hypothetical protein
MIAVFATGFGFDATTLGHDATRTEEKGRRANRHYQLLDELHSRLSVRLSNF